MAVDDFDNMWNVIGNCAKIVKQIAGVHNSLDSDTFWAGLSEFLENY